MIEIKRTQLSDEERQAVMYGLMLVHGQNARGAAARSALRKVNGVDKRLFVEEDRSVRMVPPDPPAAA